VTPSAASSTLLVANRGEVAVRIMRTAGLLDLGTVAVHATDDAAALHVRLADAAVALPAAGPAAYLDAAALLDAATTTDSDLLHPGYGFLSESGDFARDCAERDVTFVGPSPHILDLVGDKVAAKRLAADHGLPVLPGSPGPVSAEEAAAFLESLGPGGAVLLKAVSGGGGRGLRVVRTPADLPAAFERARSEAVSAFGSGALYVEELRSGARHIEVQVVGDGTGAAVALGDRDCSVQRRHQKLLEIAPAPRLDPELRRLISADAVRLTEALCYRGVGTVEFLVTAGRPTPEHVFLEMNPRLQVEHPVTEQVFGIDLVEVQLRLARGETLADLGLRASPRPGGAAVQIRICAETLVADGSVRPTAGTIGSLHLPGGPGVRVDTAAYPGWHVSPRFDSLLVKLIASTGSGPEPDDPTGVPAALRLLRSALREVRIDGVETNVGLFSALLELPDFSPGTVDTAFLDEHRSALVGDRKPSTDPLVPAHGPVTPPPTAGTAADGFLAPGGSTPVPAPLQGTVVSVEVETGAAVAAGAPLVVLEAMKMEQVVLAPVAGTVAAIAVGIESTVVEGDPLVYLAGDGSGDAAPPEETVVDLDRIRSDLAALHERRELLADAARPEAVARRHAAGHRTARENLDDLIEPGSFVEYGPLTFAAQRGRRSLEDLVARTPADGLIGGLAQVNRSTLTIAAGGRDPSRCAVLSYDYMVLAGTQGTMGHRKSDRLFDVIARLRLPTVFFAEGGGGRPGDTDYPIVSGLDIRTFAAWGRLSGLVPRIGIVGGRCFAGNAAIFGCSDITIATVDSSIGMGGPAMIEGGGLGVVAPDDVGPAAVQAANGVIDVLVADDGEAVRVARQALSYFQGAVASFDCADQRRLRSLVPENRLRIYDVRAVIETVADTDSVLELRAAFAPGMVTALARLAGRPIGVVANNPAHLAGAITSENADKAARFLQLCDAFDLPVLFLCDTPGIMVGPAAERTGLVRHASRLFVTGANLSVPFGTVVLRKGYGLGAQAMAGGGFLETLFTVSWPTGEFGAMGLEGAVRLGMRKELEAISDPDERQRVFDQVVAMAYERGKAVSMASALEIDDVIDPADTRRVVEAAFASAPTPATRPGKKRPMVDTW
jgi:acetyl/propionyl-CoA carboxylase alpha subunit/acetyl-CoA carboxylase carboxyltransferase component